jgi:hypothetical protein
MGFQCSSGLWAEPNVIGRQKKVLASTHASTEKTRVRARLQFISTGSPNGSARSPERLKERRFSKSIAITMSHHAIQHGQRRDDAVAGEAGAQRESSGESAARVTASRRPPSKGMATLPGTVPAEADVLYRRVRFFGKNN